MPADMNDYFKKRKPSLNQEPPNEPKVPVFDNSNGGGKMVSLLIVMFSIIAIFIFFKPFTIINSGEVGIKVRTGKFFDKPLGPGLHFYIPVLEKIIPVNTRIRLITYSNDNRNSLGDGYDRYEGGLRRNPAIQVLDKRDSYLLYHEEMESLVKNIKGLKRIRFFMTFSQNYLTHMRV